jgi:hypothetical protein
LISIPKGCIRHTYIALVAHLIPNVFTDSSLLITYEKAFLGQAVVKKFFTATFLERKIMSTKTITKRIALVAASALALGGFAVITAPQASAANGTATGIVVGTGTKVGDVPLSTSLAYTANKAVSALGVSSISASIGDTITVSLIAIGGTTLATDSLTVTLRNNYTVNNLETITAAAAGAPFTLFSPVARANVFTVPSVAGTYYLDIALKNTTASEAGGSNPTTSVTLVVAALTALSPSLSTVYTQSGAPTNGANADAVTSLTPVTGSSTLSATPVGLISVALKNTINAATANYTSINVAVSGSGFVVVNNANTYTTTACPTTAGLRSATSSGPALTGANFVICADGTSGTGTYTVRVTDADGTTTHTLASKTVTFSGKAKNFAASGVWTIAKSGGAQLGTATAARSAVVTTVPAVTVLITDAAGIGVVGQAANITQVSSDVTILNSDATGATCVADDGLSSVYSTGYAKIGYYNCYVTSATAAVSGKKATITFRMLDPNDATGVAYLTSAVDFTIGGSVSTDVLSLNSTSYTSGELMTLSITAKDSSGNPVHDGAATPATWTSNKNVTGLPSAASWYVGGKKSYTTGVYAPATSGDFVITTTSTATGSPTLSTPTANVEGDASASLALDAANAATDAANNAYDEAQNATQAASDALAAVTALAAQVKTLIASVKKLTAAVAKLK